MIGPLRGADGDWQETHRDKVNRLVADLLGRDAAEHAGNTSGLVE